MRRLGPVISRRSFDWGGAPVEDPWWKLFASPAAAVESGLRHTTHQAHLAASEPTTWLILDVMPTADQWLALFLATTPPRVHYEKALTNWHYYGELELQDYAFTCSQVKIGPVGIMSWAADHLPKYGICLTSACAGCGAEGGTTWKGRAEMWCADCWRSFIMAKETGKAAPDGATRGACCVVAEPHMRLGAPES